MLPFVLAETTCEQKSRPRAAQVNYRSKYGTNYPSSVLVGIWKKIHTLEKRYGYQSGDWAHSTAISTGVCQNKNIANMT